MITATAVCPVNEERMSRVLSGYCEKSMPNSGTINLHIIQLETYTAYIQYVEGPVVTVLCSKLSLCRFLKNQPRMWSVPASDDSVTAEKSLLPRLTQRGSTVLMATDTCQTVTSRQRTSLSVCTFFSVIISVCNDPVFCVVVGCILVVFIFIW